MPTFTLLSSCSKRPNNSIQAVEAELIQYLQMQAKKGHFPSRRELQQQFHLHFDKSYGGIVGIYQKAGLEYKSHINQAIKYEKAQLFTEFALSFLPSLSLKPIEVRGVHDRGVDLVALDEKGNRIGIELKGYCCFESVKQRNIEQLLRFVTSEKLAACYLFTTTDRIGSVALQKKVRIYCYSELSELANDMQRQLLQIISSKSVNQDSEDKKKKREEIIAHAQELSKHGIEVTIKRLNCDLHIAFRSYFSNILEFYKLSGLPLPRYLWGGRRGTRPMNTDILHQILEYILDNVKMGRYPTGVEIGKKFGVSHIWNIISMTELYGLLDIAPYQKRKERDCVSKQLVHCSQENDSIS